jgi:hypothetical protein
VTLPDPTPIYPDSEVELAAYKLVNEILDTEVIGWDELLELADALVHAFGYESWEQWVECNS